MSDSEDVKTAEPLDTKLELDTRLAWPAFLSEPSRRDFLGLAVTAATGAALWQLFPQNAEAQQTGTLCKAIWGQELVNPGEITRSADGILRGLIHANAQSRGITYYSNAAAPKAKSVGIFNCQMHNLRTYEGYQGWDMTHRVTPRGVAAPGPTLRARVGDKVELIFLNTIDRNMFNDTSIVSAVGQCDTSRTLNGTERYVGIGADGVPHDKFPNCFHASNTTNLHYHGTHTTPRAFGDNVLVGVIPDPKLNLDAVIKMCTDAYGKWNTGGNPTQDLREASANLLSKLLEAAKNENNQVLIDQLSSAIDSNVRNVAHGEWPQYWPGFYPYFFDLPAYNGPDAKGDPTFPLMGQAPGTHWYHCHQHGSTTLQILNGMAGLLIIEGDYDDKLRALGGGTIREKVMIFQLFAEQPNLVNTNPSAGAQLAVNGQVYPTVSMKKGEVQWWRIAQAAMKSHGQQDFLFLDSIEFQKYVDDPTLLKDQTTGKTVPPPTVFGVVPALRQTAQDGVQYQWKNYNKPPVQSFLLSPGNRADFLVSAPATKGTMYLVYWPAAGTGAIKDIRSNTVLKVVVDGDPVGVNTTLPTETTYPVQPDYLGDITKLGPVQRTVTFEMKGAAGGPPNQPVFTIDGKQFQEGIIDQIMLLGGAEEWILRNTSVGAVTHPFHIHINPFQITEVFDPSLPAGKQLQVLPQPWIWWDTIAIPAGVADPNDATKVIAGYVKMRSRFVDYPGMYVLHCHILGHEDRGMMQLVEVIDNKTAVKHH